MGGSDVRRSTSLPIPNLAPNKDSETAAGESTGVKKRIKVMRTGGYRK